MIDSGPSTGLKVCAIAAMDENRVIGSAGKLPWHLPEDMAHFKRMTEGHAVLMGRLTYESLPPKFRPLPNRKNIVVTSKPEQFPAHNQLELISDPLNYIESCRRNSDNLPSNQLWIVGGEKIYRSTMPEWDELFLTVVHSKHNGDAVFPEFEDKFYETSREDYIKFSFLTFKRVLSSAG